MTHQRYCANCGRLLGSSEQYCNACGTRVEGLEYSEDQAGRQPCPLCGQLNLVEARTCESCGAALRNSSEKKTSAKSKKKQAGTSKSARSARKEFLPGWKFIVALVVVVVAVIIYVESHNAASTGNPVFADHGRISARDIDSLRQVVQQNPMDATALVHLANLYYDTKLFPEAIETYNRYLQFRPSDADARVDLGVAYFNLSFTDSVHHQEYVQRAKDEMTKATTYQPNHQLAYFNLGIVELHSGDIQQANESFRKCIEIDSTSEAARTAKQFLSQHPNISPPTS